jgi:phenylacetate-CoA ligase
MRRIDKIVGRSDDTIIRGVNVFPTQIEELILQLNSAYPAFLSGSGQRWPSGRIDRFC